MAKTFFETTDALTREAFEEVLFQDTAKETFWANFMGAGNNNIVQTDDRFTKEKGDRITFGIAARLGGLAGTVRGEETLEGKEDKLNTSSFDVTLERVRFAIRDRGALDRQRPAFSLDNVSMMKLRDRGSEVIDDLAFEKIYDSPTTTIFGGDATSKATLDTTDLITPDLASRLRAIASTGRNRRQTPIRGIQLQGRKWWIYLTHPDSMHDLFEDPQFQQARREAEVRGDQNPIFTGSRAIYNGVVFQEHESVEIFTDGGAGANVPGVRSLFLGQQALVWAWGQRPEIVAKEFDYDDEHGFAWGIIAGIEKPKFDLGQGAFDYGSFEVNTARTKLSDA